MGGIVNHNIEPTELLVRTANRFEITCAIDDVQLQRQKRIAELGRQTVKPTDLTGGPGDAIPARQRRTRPGAA
jgi:hypothetical protein